MPGKVQDITEGKKVMTLANYDGNGKEQILAKRLVVFLQKSSDFLTITPGTRKN